MHLPRVAERGHVERRLKDGKEATPLKVFTQLATIRDHTFPNQAAMDAWLDTDPFGNSDAPGTPFDMEEYQLESVILADELLNTAEARSQEAREHNQQSDDYVLMAVVFASVLFFVGLSSKLPNPKSGLAILIVGIVLFVAAAAVVLTFPIEI